MAESTSVVIYDPRQAGPEVVALAGFLAGYSGRTREAYTLDLRLRPPANPCTAARRGGARQSVGPGRSRTPSHQVLPWEEACMAGAIEPAHDSRWRSCATRA